MLEFRMGLNRDKRRDQLVNTVKEWCEEDLTKRVYVLVPGPTTFSIHRDILHRLGNQVTAEKLRVVDFGGVLRLFKKEVGGMVNLLDEGGRLLAMAAAMANVKDGLKYYKRTADKADTIKKMMDTYTYLKNADAEETALKNAIETLRDKGSSTLLSKCEDINLIFQEYKNVCEASKADSLDALCRLSDELNDRKKSEWLSNTKWYIDGFTDFTAPQTGIVDAIVGHASDVVFNFAAAGMEDDKLSSIATVATASALEKMFIKNWSKTPVIIRTGDDSPEHPALAEIQKNLCSGKPVTESTVEGAEKRIKMLCDPSVYLESTHVAGIINDAIRRGTRYRQISVVLCDYPKYAPIVESCFRRYNIPTYFASEKDVIAKKPAMLAINKALDSATHGMQKEDVIQYLKTGMSKLDMENIDKLENYIRTWNIHGNGFDAEWNMNPNGYGIDSTEETEAELAAINEYKAAAITPLVELRDALAGGSKVKDYILALNNFLTAIEYHEKIQETVELLQKKDNTQLAKEYAQVTEVITNAMEQMYLIIGSHEKSVGEFTKLFKILCTAYKIATIPVSVDQVEVFSIEDARFTCSSLRCVMGATDDKFPEIKEAGAGLFSATEIEKLRKEKLAIAGSADDMTLRAMSDIDAVISGAKKGICFSYTNDPAAPSAASNMLHKIHTMFPAIDFEQGAGENGIYKADLQDARNAGMLLGRISNKPQYDNIALALSTVENDVLQNTADDMMERASWELGNISAKDATSIYGKEVALSATKMDVYSACRYHYFLQYGLKLTQAADGRITSPVFGKFAHAVLEKAVREIEKKHGGFQNVTLDQMESITRKYMDAYIEKKMKGIDKASERYQYLLKRNCREIMTIMRNVCDEFKVSDFHGTEFEYRVGGDRADMPDITVRGKRLTGKFSGIIDRIDVATVDGEEYIRLADYKSGKVKTFDKADILVGQSLQLLIYQAALQENGLIGREAKAAGVLYVPAKEAVTATKTRATEDKVLAERQKMLTRRGILLDNKEVINAMEHSDGKQCVFLPVKFKADGSISGDVCSAEQIDSLNKFAMAKMKCMIDDIGSGNVEANPLSRGLDRNACSYCPMKDACHKDICGTRFRYRKTVKDEEFWKQVEAES